MLHKMINTRNNDDSDNDFSYLSLICKNSLLNMGLSPDLLFNNNKHFNKIIYESQLRTGGTITKDGKVDLALHALYFNMGGFSTPIHGHYAGRSFRREGIVRKASSIKLSRNKVINKKKNDERVTREKDILKLREKKNKLKELQKEGKDLMNSARLIMDFMNSMSPETIRLQAELENEVNKEEEKEEEEEIKGEEKYKTISSETGIGYSSHLIEPISCQHQGEFNAEFFPYCSESQIKLDTFLNHIHHQILAPNLYFESLLFGITLLEDIGDNGVNIKYYDMLSESERGYVNTKLNNFKRMQISIYNKMNIHNDNIAEIKHAYLHGILPPTLRTKDIQNGSFVDVLCNSILGCTTEEINTIHNNVNFESYKDMNSGAAFLSITREKLNEYNSDEILHYIDRYFEMNIDGKFKKKEGSSGERETEESFEHTDSEFYIMMQLWVQVIHVILDRWRAVFPCLNEVVIGEVDTIDDNNDNGLMYLDTNNLPNGNTTRLKNGSLFRLPEENKIYIIMGYFYLFYNNILYSARNIEHLITMILLGTGQK